MKQLTGKESVFKLYWSMVRNRYHQCGKNDPKAMVTVKVLDNKLSANKQVLKAMGMLQDCLTWGKEQGYYDEFKAKDKEFRERFGTKDEPKEKFKYNETDNFRRLTLAYYHEAIQNQGISHEEFMQRFKNEFSDVLNEWEVQKNEAEKQN